jgi:hypothetical protein
MNRMRDYCAPYGGGSGDSTTELMKALRQLTPIWRLDTTPCIYCNMFRVTETRFGLVIGFINNPQVVTTITYNTVTDLHT